MSPKTSIRFLLHILHYFFVLQATYQRKRIPLSDLKSIIIAIETFLSSKANHIDDTILWNCLDDDIDDDAIVEDMRHIDPRGIAQGGNSSHGSRTSMILKLREFILERLLHNILQMNSNISSASRMPHSEVPRRQQDSVSLRGTSRLFRMTTSLLDVYFINNVSCDLECAYRPLFDSHSFLWMWLEGGTRKRHGGITVVALQITPSCIFFRNQRFSHKLSITKHYLSTKQEQISF